MTDPEHGPKPEQTSQRGSALVLAMITVVMLAGVLITLSFSVRSQAAAAVEGEARELQMQAAEIGLAKGLMKVMSDLPGWAATAGATPVDIVGAAPTDSDGPPTTQDAAWVTIQRLDTNTAPPHTFHFRSRGFSRTARDANALRVVELDVVITKAPPTPIVGFGAGAVVGAGDFKTSGNISIDGRDHAMDGTLRTDVNAQHSPAFTITGDLDQDGSSDVGGGTTAPTSGATDGDGTLDEETAIWQEESSKSGSWDADGYDNDNDGQIDESGEGTDQTGWDGDGYDNDGDGIADTDGDMPERFGDMFGTTNADLKDHAIAKGTYFRSDGGTLKRHNGTNFVSPEVTYSTWVASSDATGGGDIVYIETTQNGDLGQFDLPDTGSGDPTMLIIQDEYWTDPEGGGGLLDDIGDLLGDDDDDDDDGNHHQTTAGPIHINNATFKGVLVADDIDKLNGNGTLLGAVFAYNSGNASQFGNGTFNLRFSSEVLGNLPAPDSAASPASIEHWLWREAVPVPSDVVSE